MPKIKDLPRVDRPRERFLKKGAEALSKSDLLAILLSSGIKGKNVQELSRSIIKKFGNDFLNITVGDLQKIQGIGEAKAMQISAAIALIKRFYDEQNGDEIIVKNLEDVLALARDLRDKKKEYLICLHLNARNALIKRETVSVGLLDKSLLHPREVFAPALESRAASVILVHNHPSGDPKPSKKDKEIVKKIAEAGNMLGVRVTDFVITANKGSYSFFETLNKDKEDLDYVSDAAQCSLFDLLLTEEKKTYEGRRRVDTNTFKFIDLFAGIGGFHTALHNLGAQCVFASEIDDHARYTYEHNHRRRSPELFDSGYFNKDINEIEKPAEQMPDFDILTAGFPCQPFSQAGFKKGFEDTRGTLFFNIANIIKEKQPAAFFLENVRGLLNHNDGETFATIKRVIKEDLGYSFFWQIVKASDFGLPQHRPRLFMVGFKDKSIWFEFPKPVPLIKTMKDIFEAPCEKKIGYTLRCGGRGSGINDRRNWDCYLVDGKEKRLSPVEGKRMQGFPEDFEFPVSETQAMKQLGNSVAVPAIQAVAERIIDNLKLKS